MTGMGTGRGHMGRKECLKRQLGLVVHVFNPTTWEAEVGGSIEFKAILVYITSCRDSQDYSDPVSKQTNRTGGTLTWDKRRY